jgi:riboflavin transporter FmnP
MNPEKLSELTDEELLQEAKKMKSASITNGLLIGFLVGVIFFSVMKSSLGFFTLIPLYFIYKLTNNSAYYKELKSLLKERNLN